MNPNLAIAISIGLIASFVTSASAQTATDARKEDCISKMEDQSAALSAADWSSLQALAKRYLRECKGVIDADWDSKAFQNIAVANLFLGRPAEALAASSSCVEISYSNALCHVHRVNALLKLNRVSEARSALNTTERLIPYRLEVLRADLNRPLHPLKREEVVARIGEVEAAQELLSVFARRLSN